MNKQMKRWVACVAVALAGFALLPAGASAQRGIDTGFADVLFTSSDPGVSGPWLNRARNQAASDIVRLHVLWSSISPTVPSNPSDPNDPAYRFAALDTAVRSAHQRGLTVMINPDTAPPWARGSDPGCRDRRPNPDARFQIACRPDQNAYGLFAEALARRYSGRHPDPLLPGRNLPRVRFFQAWNEPNLPGFLMPQRANYDRGPLVSPRFYVNLLNRFYAGIKRAQRNALVVTAGTAPFGSSAGQGQPRVRPLEFWRGVLCLRQNLRPAPRRNCAGKPRFDIIAHHPISIGTSPHRRAAHRDDMVVADLHKLRRTLRAAQRRNLIAGRARGIQMWVDEFWWQTRPPERGGCAVPVRRHANFISEALYLMWKQGVRAAINLQIVDSVYEPDRSCVTAGNIQSGVYFRNGKAKPGLRAMRFPFVTERKRNGRIVMWGKVPGRGGQVAIERKRGNRWQRVGRIRVGNNRVFGGQTRMGGRPQMRAVYRGGERSLPWRPR